MGKGAFAGFSLLNYAFSRRNGASKGIITSGLPVTSFRHRLKHSEFIVRIPALLISSFLRFCHVTTIWQREGMESLRADLAEGPVLMLAWHERLLMAPVHWPASEGQVSILCANSLDGRLSAATHRRFGQVPIEMADNVPNLAASRRILRRVRAGTSIGMTPDGPCGPALAVKDAALDWARIMQRPVYAYAYATKRHRRMGTWDRMILALPFTRGAFVLKRLTVDVPRKADAAQICELRHHMVSLLNDATRRADHLASR